MTPISRLKMQEHLSEEMKNYSFEVLTPCFLEDKVSLITVIQFLQTWSKLADIQCKPNQGGVF